MSDMLLGISARVVHELRARGDLLLVDGATMVEVVRYVTNYLAESRTGHSLVSRLSEALLSCPGVDELYADDDELKELIQDFGLTR